MIGSARWRLGSRIPLLGVDPQEHVEHPTDGAVRNCLMGLSELLCGRARILRLLKSLAGLILSEVTRCGDPLLQIGELIVGHGRQHSADWPHIGYIKASRRG